MSDMREYFRVTVLVLSIDVLVLFLLSQVSLTDTFTVLVFLVTVAVIDTAWRL